MTRSCCSSDHQSGLFQLVRDVEQPILRAHLTALQKKSFLARIPTFTTASTPDWPNGPLMPEIHQHNPDASRFQGLRIMETKKQKLKRLNEKGRSAGSDPKSIS